MKKNRWLLIYILLINSGLIIFGILFLNNNLKNEQLQDTINQQNNLIKNTTKRDSTYTEKNKGYSDTLNKYTDSYSVKIGNKEYKFLDLLKLYNQIEQQNYDLKDSLNYLSQLDKINKKDKDTVGVGFRILYNFAKQKYKFQVAIRKDIANRNTKIFFTGFSRADSAQLLFKYFKNRMIETSPGTWTIDQSGNKIIIKP
ncbi:MAG: hypothetical protein JWP94_3304 [Mucilaginibacter sp.]|nr:hypothetical protein [Mucilaginibacter sp.]